MQACELLMSDRLTLGSWFPHRNVEWRDGRWQYVSAAKSRDATNKVETNMKTSKSIKPKKTVSDWSRYSMQQNRALCLLDRVVPIHQTFITRQKVRWSTVTSLINAGLVELVYLVETDRAQFATGMPFLRLTWDGEKVKRDFVKWHRFVKEEAWLTPTLDGMGRKRQDLSMNKLDNDFASIINGHKAFMKQERKEQIMQELLLEDRIAQATGPCRELDAELARLAGHVVVFDKSVPTDKTPYYEPVKGQSWVPVLLYTGSHDAALSLIGEYVELSIYAPWENEEDWTVSVTVNTSRTGVFTLGESQTVLVGRGKTTLLALCDVGQQLLSGKK